MNDVMVNVMGGMTKDEARGIKKELEEKILVRHVYGK